MYANTKEVHIYEDGGAYVGERKDGLRHGEGTMVYANGNRYIGHWKEDKRHGKNAKMILLDGSTFEGEYINGKRCGYGEINFKRINEGYSGYFKNSKMHG